MFIQTESTANLDVMKFLPGEPVLKSGTASFRDAEAAKRSPLAERLFQLDGVQAVGLEAEAIAITKEPGLEWHKLKPALLGIIMEHFVAGRPVLLDGAEAGPDADADEILKQVQELIDTRVAPALSASGAEIAVDDYTDGVLTMTTDDPGAIAGMRMGIENIIRHYVPDILDLRIIARRASPEENIANNKPGLNSDEAQAIYVILDEQINPAVASHGGHISLVDVQGDTAYIRLEGGCQGCGMADVTLKAGVETAIKGAVPSIAAVLDTTDHAGGSNPYYQPGTK